MARVRAILQKDRKRSKQNAGRSQVRLNNFNGYERANRTRTRHRQLLKLTIERAQAGILNIGCEIGVKHSELQRTKTSFQPTIL